MSSSQDFKLGDLVLHKSGEPSPTMCVCGLSEAPGIRITERLPAVSCRWYTDKDGWRIETFLSVELVLLHKRKEEEPPEDFKGSA